MRNEVKRAAVRYVKPRVSPHAWQVLRDPMQKNVVPRPKPAPPAKPRPSLTDLAIETKTDKWGMHFYTTHYERHLKHLRDTTFTLFEIGIGGYSRAGDGGFSLRMWEQFFPKARIVGLDIEDKSFLDGGRIRTYQGSQVDPEVLARIVADHDDIKVIIDDGSHRCEHIRESFAYLFPTLPDDGIYAIEDTQTSYWPAWGGSEVLTEPTTSVSMVKDLVDGLHWQEFIDPSYEPTHADAHLKSVHAYHNLVILEKGNNVEGTNKGRIKRPLSDGAPAPTVVEQRHGYQVHAEPVTAAAVESAT